ncbi:hypothetical protein FB451DRAFT_1179000 [Mycena latifolia]|nr:hypothetical protein FB451DRAFT_1179000 [Mycena latifolia]
MARILATRSDRKARDTVPILAVHAPDVTRASGVVEWMRYTGGDAHKVDRLPGTVALLLPPALIASGLILSRVVDYPSDANIVENGPLIKDSPLHTPASHPASPLYAEHEGLQRGHLYIPPEQTPAPGWMDDPRARPMLVVSVEAAALMILCPMLMNAQADYDDWPREVNPDWGAADLILLAKKLETYRAGVGLDAWVVWIAKGIVGGHEMKISKDFLVATASFPRGRGFSEDLNDFSTGNVYGRVLFNGENGAVGIEYHVGDALLTAYAARLVMISAGALCSPVILERSPRRKAGVFGAQGGVSDVLVQDEDGALEV